MRPRTSLFLPPNPASLPAPSTPAETPLEQPTADGKKPMSNLAQRVIFGIIGAALLLGSVWYSAWTFALFFAGVQAKMLLEFYRMMRKAGYQPAKWLGLAASLIIFALVAAITFYQTGTVVSLDEAAETARGTAFNLTAMMSMSFRSTQVWSGFFGSVGIVGMVVAMASILREMTRWPDSKQPFANVGATLSGLLYVTVPMTALIVVASVPSGYDYRRVFALLFMVWCSDIGAYAAGKTFGKHKLAPKISPGKTWEGAVGGFLLTLVMGWALGFWLTDIPLTYRLVAAGIVAVFGPLGDLAESMLKRSVDVKDSGTIMPGHGGLLDRFDAFLFILPVLALAQLLWG
jgi:phosphatidate cytidylyltransferase